MTHFKLKHNFFTFKKSKNFNKLEKILINNKSIMEESGNLVKTGLAEKIKELRKITGFGFTECKDALMEAEGDIKKATQTLEAKNSLIAQKKVERLTKSGIIMSYTHKTKGLPPQKGSLIDLRCESDYVAVRPEFANLAKELAIEIVIQNPEFISIAHVPNEIMELQINKELEILLISSKTITEELKIKAKEKASDYFKTKCLLSLSCSKDSSITIEQYIANHIALFRENIKILRFQRFEIGND